MLKRTKLPLRSVQGQDRPAQEVQSALRQVARDVNDILQCVAIDEYVNTDSWGNTVSGTASTAFVDSLQRINLAAAVKPNDVLEISGRAFVGTDAGVGGNWQIAVYENTRTRVAQKPTTLYHVSGVGFDKFTFACKHVVKTAGVAMVVLQQQVASGAGNVYVFARGNLLIRTWRP